jgi:hypothetical protein
MHVLLMFVTRTLENVFTLQSQFLHLQIFAPLLLAIKRTEFTPIQRTVMTIIHAPSTLAIPPQELANTRERIVTITMHVPLTLAMQIPETVFILQWFVPISILAPKKPVTLSRDASTLLNMI